MTKETLVQLFSSEFCEIFKNTYFVEHPRTPASEVTIFKSSGYESFLENPRKSICDCPFIVKL